jgi:Heparinase II/III-like protein/Domain of unknown function (DUF4962)
MNKRYIFLAPVAVCIVMLATAQGQQPAFPPKVSLDEIRHRISQNKSVHPRLLATREQLASLSRSLDKDPLRKQLANSIIQHANALCNAESVERKLQGRRLLSVSRQCVQRVLLLATAYHLTGDTRYADRCRKEMLAAARFSDWNPSHFLDVAEMTFALAIGYDWLYDQLDAASRKEIRTAIVEKSLKLPFETKYRDWVHARNNWGQVCHGGLTAGALAVMDDEPDLAARTVQNAVENVVTSMAAFAPHGSFPEGPGYWNYGTTYNVLLIASLESALGTDFSLAAAPGFSETGAYPAMVYGPSGQYFNYADGHAGRSPDPILFWFASRYHRPDWLVGERELWKSKLSQPASTAPEKVTNFMPFALLWMTDSETSREVKLPLNWSVGGKVPISVHRSSWSDPHATFVGLKAGSPSASHAHMDIGSFVLDSDGVRWATDLGSEGYDAIEQRKMDLWNTKQNADRWKIFRLNNFSHNTLVIDDQLQVTSGDAPIVAFSDNPEKPYSIVDMTTIYSGQAASIRRGVALLPTHEVLIQDELTGLRPGTHVRWGMVTTGTPDDLGKNTCVLHQNGQQLTLSVLAPEKTVLSQIDTAKPRHEWDSPNPGTQMIAIEMRAPKSGELTIAVVATPGTSRAPISNQPKVEPLKSWGNEH